MAKGERLMPGSIQSSSQGGTMKRRRRKNGEQGRVGVSPTGEEKIAKKMAARNRTAYLFGVGFFLYLWFLSVNLIGQAVVALRPAGHRAITRFDLFTSLSFYAFPLLGCVIFLWIVVQGTKPIFASREVV